MSAYRIGGQVVDQGAAVSGQPVIVVDTADADPSNWTVEAATTTAVDGTWSVIVPSGDLDRYHAVTQFEDNNTTKNAESKPFVTAQPVLRAVEIPIQFDIPAPQTIGNAIPDSGIVYDFDAASVSANEGDDVTTWTDAEASIQVDGSATYRSSTSSLDDNPTLEFDGSSDGYTQSDTTINTDVSTPLSIHCVIDPVDTGGAPRVVDSTSSDSYFQLIYGNKRSYDLRTSKGTANRFGTPTSNPQVLTGIMGGGSGVEIRRDGTTLGSDSDDDGNYNGDIVIGFRSGGSEYFDGNVARVIWNDTSQVNATDLDQALINKYGI